MREVPLFDLSAAGILFAVQVNRSRSFSHRPDFRLREVLISGLRGVVLQVSPDPVF